MDSLATYNPLATYEQPLQERTGNREQNFKNKWTNMYKRLYAYQQEHDGSCDVPQRYPLDPQLGQWVMAQRNNRKKGKLTKERYDQLEAIGFEWTSDQTYRDKWAKMFKSLQTYQQEHNGSCNVPQKYPLDPQLGAWVTNQRTFYRKGLLAKERCDQLEKIGFEWCRKDLKDYWTKMFKRLEAYKQEHNGSCNVTRKYVDRQLGIWVMNQRAQYKKGKLTKKQCDQLEEIGFQWTLSKKGLLAKERRDRLEAMRFQSTESYCEQSLEDEWTKMLERLQSTKLAWMCEKMPGRRMGIKAKAGHGAGFD